MVTIALNGYHFGHVSDPYNAERTSSFKSEEKRTSQKSAVLDYLQ